MKWTAWLLAIIGIGVLSSTSGFAQQLESMSYRIEAIMDTENQTLSATQHVTYPNNGNTPLSSLYFLLMPNLNQEANPFLNPVIVDASFHDGFDPSWLQIGEVFDEQGNAVAWSYEAAPIVFQRYSLENAVLRVDLNQPLPPGETATLKMGFETKFPNSLSPDQSVHNGLYTWRFAWNPIAVSSDDLIEGNYFSAQRPYYEQTLPAGLYSLTLTVPSNFSVAAGLNIQEEISMDEEAGTKTLEFESEVPVRSVALSMGEKFRVYTLANTHIPISVYYLPGEEAAARQIATYAIEILEAFSERWGPYAYKQLSLVSSWASGFFGMAADGLIVLGNSAFSEKDLTVNGMSDRLMEYLVAHEIAHQWWGIGVGSDLNAENYISEGFSEYFAITYFEDKYGSNHPNVIQIEREGFGETLVESQFGYLNLRQHFSELPYLVQVRNRFDEALVKPQQEVEFFNNNTTRVYNKGYLVLRALAGLIGQDAMDQVLLQAYTSFNHRQLTSEGFRTLAEEASGQSLKEFFDDWIYGDASMDYAIEAVNTEQTDGGQFLIQVELSRRGQGRLPVQIVVLSEDGQSVERLWHPESDPHTLTFTTQAPLKEVQIDPQNWTPDTTRINNYYPTRLRIIPDGEADVPLDAYLIRFDPVSRVLEGGFVLDYRWLLADGLLAFVFNQGRGNTIDGALVIGEEILAEFGWNLTHYLNPDLGLEGQYWEPSHRLRLSLSRRLDFDEDPINFLGLNYTFSQLLTSRHLFQVNALADPFSFYRINGTALYQMLLWANTVLDLQAQFGYSAGEVPGFLLYNLAELNGFYDYSDDQRRKLNFPGLYKATARIGATFPLRRDMVYSVGGLALAREITGHAYVSAGQTWNQWDQFSLDTAKVEIGFEATVSGQAFGGLLGFNVTAGFAVPLNGQAGFQGALLEPYFRFNIPFF